MRAFGVAFLAVLLLLSACAGLKETNRADIGFDGTWEFDAASTRKHMLSLPRWTEESVNHLIRAYKPHTYVFSGGDYLMLLGGEETRGTLTVIATHGGHGGVRSVRFTCPRQEEDEIGTFEMKGDVLIYRSHTPMFKGEALYYKRTKNQRAASLNHSGRNPS